MKMGLGPRGENIQKNEKSKKRGEKTIFFWLILSGDFIK